ncbi:MAG: hypothetical protein HQK91_04270 [Nitrospirae bacterium]|nr:hypothetical protein [Nitrospirota bacterium]
MKKEFAESFASPSYKWIGNHRTVKNMQNWQISNYPGCIGFAFQEHSSGMSLKVVLKAYRDDGTRENFIINTYHCGDFGNGYQKWQTHQLPLFPYESCHGKITNVKFSYIVHKDGRSIPSQYNYKFASLPEFERGNIGNDDFHDSYFKNENNYVTNETNGIEVQDALNRINKTSGDLPIQPFFTRGNRWDPSHPVNEIHRQIDWVIEKKKQSPQKRRYIHMAIFDIDNYYIAKHLIYAKECGVEVECFADWAAVSSMNCTEHVAMMRRAGIAIYGVVRNTPGDPTGGISSMHTKIIIFDGEIVHSSSYNLHFHLWGGNWENGISYYSQDYVPIYENIYNAIRGGVIAPVNIKPYDRYNLYYSFGSNNTQTRNFYRPQDAIITEINNAKYTIIICMFELGHLSGCSEQDNHETDVVSAIINARNRGINVKVILNGMINHTGDLPDAKDIWKWRPLKDPVRRLKEEWIDLNFVYYWESIYSPIHHKFAVIDNDTVITESYNWYITSLYSDETLAVIRDKKTAQEFTNEAYKILESFRIGHD